MTPPITFTNLNNPNIDCTIHLDVLYPSQKDREAFDKRWVDFLSADEGHAQVLRYESDTITYPHKSWLPEKQNGKPSLLLLFGNPAPHSVIKDVYFAYEGSGTEHRFWKVLRELGFTDLSVSGDDVPERKPALHGFHRMIELSGVPAEQIVYVGDRVDVDIKPAEQLGMKTCLIYGESDEADYCIDDFAKLKEIV